MCQIHNTNFYSSLFVIWSCLLNLTQNLHFSPSHELTHYNLKQRFSATFIMYSLILMPMNESFTVSIICSFKIFPHTIFLTNRLLKTWIIKKGIFCYHYHYWQCHDIFLHAIIFLTQFAMYGTAITKNDVKQSFLKLGVYKKTNFITMCPLL